MKLKLTIISLLFIAVLAGCSSNNQKPLQDQCQADNGAACTQLGLNLYYSNPKQAFIYHQKACSLNDVWGCYQLSGYYIQGRAVAKNLPLAKQALEKACGLSNADDDGGISCNDLAYMYGNEGQLEKSITYYDKACTLTDTAGCMNLVQVYTNRYQQSKDKADAQKVESYLQKACQIKGDKNICSY